MSELEDKILEANRERKAKIKEEEKEIKMAERESKRIARREKREETFDKVATAVKAPFVAIKEGIIKAHEATLGEIEAKKTFKEGYEEYLKFAEQSKGKEGTIETEEQRHGSIKTVLYTDHGPLICTELAGSRYDWERTFQGFFGKENGIYDYRVITIKAEIDSVNSCDAPDMRYKSDGFVLNPENGKITHDDTFIGSYLHYDDYTKCSSVARDTMSEFDALKKEMEMPELPNNEE